MAKTTKTTKVDPLPGLAPWVGGKRLLAQKLVARIEAIPHTCYAEPFAGMGGVFFRRRLASKTEVLNDLSTDVVNLFRIIQRHPDAFLAQLQYHLHSRAEFDRQLAIPPDTLTDVERAARFYFLQCARFSGRPTNNSFPATVVSAKGQSPDRVVDRINRAWRRLARVTMERLPYQDFIRRYDRPTTLFYLDPPYWGRESIYGKGMFQRADFDNLASLLASIRGHFIMSLDDRPETRALFARFNIETATTLYTFKGTGKVASELIITGGGRAR